MADDFLQLKDVVVGGVDRPHGLGEVVQVLGVPTARALRGHDGGGDLLQGGRPRVLAMRLGADVHRDIDLLGPRDLVHQEHVRQQRVQWSIQFLTRSLG